MLDGQPDAPGEQAGLLAALFAALPVAVQVWDPAGREVLSNAACRALLPNIALRERLAHSDWSRAGAGETVGPIFLTLGSDREVECTLMPLRTAEGRVAHIAGMFKDGTRQREQRIAADAARLAQEHLRLVLENAPFSIFALDAQGRYRYVEGQRLRRLGLEPRDFIGRSALELLAEDPVSLDAIRRALAGETVTFRSASPAGGTFEARLVPGQGPDPAAAGVFGITYDVTEQDQAEQALRRSEERLRLALTAGRLVAFELDLRTGTSTFSSNAQEVLGVPASELSLEKIVSLLHPDDMASALVSRDYTLETGMAIPDVRYRLIRPDNGETVWFERRTTLTCDPSGALVSVRGLMIDVSERMHAEELTRRGQELHLENQRILEVSRLKSRFLASMSHELRTPLNAVIGFAELLHDRPMEISPAREQEFTGHIISGGKHLLHLIDDLLDMAKIESGKQEFRPEPVVLAELVREVCELLRVVAADKQVRVVCELDGSLSDLVIDPARFKQVVFNYLSNAIKFSPSGGQVTVRTIAEGERAFRLEVQDVGPGIAPGDLGRLFRDFQQLREGSDARHRGTGLGLVLTRGIVEAQGGSVAVHSTLGVGSTFIATLPRQQLRRTSARPQPLPPRAGPCRVLVVEDDAHDSERIVDVLVGAGHTVVAVQRGAAALELCQRQRFDVVTVDLLLPDTSGLALVAAIRMTQHHRDVPVVVISELSDRRVLAGFDVQEVLLKPITEARLVSSFQRVLGTLQEAPAVQP